MIPKNIKSLQSQSRDLQARRVDRNTIVVESTTNPAANHVVTVKFSPDGKIVRTRCTCAWAQHRGVACSHVMAALEYLASTKNRTLSFWDNREDAARQKQRMFFLTADSNRRVRRSKTGDTAPDGVWITSRTG